MLARNERGAEEPNHRHVRLLRARRERPRRRRAAEQRDELAPFHLRGHSITSSARASSVGGFSSRIALAVLRLTTSLNFVGICTGRSAGFSPRRMRSTYSAVLRIEVVTVADEPAGLDGCGGCEVGGQTMLECQHDDQRFVGPSAGVREDGAASILLGGEG